MTKKPKPTPLPVTAETISKAADTNAIKDLVTLSDAFYRVGVLGPFETQLPLFVSMFIGGDKNQYRKGNVTVGTRFNTDKVSLGKKAGLIFSFTPVEHLDRNGEKVERIEISWDDIVNTFDGLADQIETRLNGKPVADINVALKEAIDRNPSMHKILSEGFVEAQSTSRQEAVTEKLEELPEFGMFG